MSRYMEYTLNKKEIKLFGLCIIIYLMSAFVGWLKLSYGFNFTDEGYCMTEAWRLISGDNFFLDKFTGAINLSPLINVLIFKVHPDITLLELRELQYILTIVSLLSLSVALFIVSQQFWFQPLIFSIFAFTGLDPVGMFTILN